jgi:Mechanosensitive ion channel, conserved TM helix
MEQHPVNSVSDVFVRITDYLPSLIAGAVVLLLGLVVAWIGQRLVVRLLVLSRLDRIVVRLGWGHALDKGDVRHSLFDFVGLVVGGLIFVVFLENAILIWRLTVLSQLLERVVLLIPKLIAAVVILLIGWGVAGGVSRAVRRALYQEEFERARLVARIIYAAILLFTIALALVELEIAVPLVTGAFLIAFGAIALTAVLAIGLGSRRAVEKLWDEHLDPSQGKPATDSEAKNVKKP